MSEQLLLIRNNLFRTICTTLAQSGLDAAIGVLVLDAIKADLLAMITEASIEKLTASANIKKEEETNNQE